MTRTVAVPQTQTGEPDRRPKSKATSEPAAQEHKLLKQKEATLAVVKQLLDTESHLHGNTLKDLLAYAKHHRHAHGELKGNGIPELKFDPWADYKNRCKGGKSSVSKWMEIADHPSLNDPKNFKYLPARFSILYELTALSVGKFNATPKSTIEKEGTINPAMSREQARELVGKEPHPKRMTAKVAAAEAAAKLAAANNEDHREAAEILAGQDAANVSDTDPRNTRAAGSDGKLGGPDFYEKRGALPDGPVPSPKAYTFAPPLELAPNKEPQLSEVYLDFKLSFEDATQEHDAAIDAFIVELRDGVIALVKEVYPWIIIGNVSRVDVPEDPKPVETAQTAQVAALMSTQTERAAA
jgi:hypothetical protein